MSLTDEIAAYEEMQATLECEFLGKWALVHERELIGTFKSFEDAATIAVERFGAGPYLIREIGRGPVTLPASVLYQSVSANAHH